MLKNKKKPKLKIDRKKNWTKIKLNKWLNDKRKKEKKKGIKQLIKPYVANTQTKPKRRVTKQKRPRSKSLMMKISVNGEYDGE